MRILLPLAAMAAIAQVRAGSEPVKPSAEALAAYWRSIAYHYAADAAFERSLTSSQKQARETVEQADRETREARAKLAKSCPADTTLDESGTDPVCKPKPKPEAKPKNDAPADDEDQ